MERYKRNFGTIGEDGQKILNSKKVLVVGCGGLGGFVIEGLARMGIKAIGVCDYDSFENTNLNRQILCMENNLGNKKIDTAKDRIKKIDNDISVTTYSKAFPNDEVLKDFSKYDLIIDCLDSILVRSNLEKVCLQNNKKLIYGAVGGYYGALGVISHENKLIEKIAENGMDNNSNVEKEMGNPFGIVGVVASLQVHLATLVLLNKDYLKKGMYYIDIESFSIEEIVF